MSEPENGSYSALLGSEGHAGPRRSDSSTAPAEASTAVVRQSGAAHPPGGARAGGTQSAPRARARLKEVRGPETLFLKPVSLAWCATIHY